MGIVHWSSRGANTWGFGEKKKSNQAQVLLQRQVMSPNKMLCWPITYMQAHIPGGLIYNVNNVFLLFTSRSFPQKIKHVQNVQ